MVCMTIKEIKDTHKGIKKITIRQRTSKGNMPFNVGTKTFLKLGRTKERYGQIEIIEAIEKPLGEMTEEEAQLGGYDCADDYINDHIHNFNKGIDRNTMVIFYRYEIIWTDSDLIQSL